MRYRVRFICVFIAIAFWLGFPWRAEAQFSEWLGRIDWWSDATAGYPWVIASHRGDSSYHGTFFVGARGGLRVKWVDLGVGLQNYWLTNAAPFSASPGGNTTIDAGTTAFFVYGAYRPLRRERTDFCDLLVGMSVGPAWRRIGGVSGGLIAFAAGLEVSLLLYPSRRSHWFLGPTVQQVGVSEAAHSSVGLVRGLAFGVGAGYASGRLPDELERD